MSSRNSHHDEIPKDIYQQKTQNMTIFVGNMPYKMTWKDLKDFFSQFGSVKYAKCVTDFVTNKRKGFGFVEFASEDDAYTAKSAHDSELCYEGRTLRVKSANQRSSQRSIRNSVAPASARHHKIKSVCPENDAELEDYEYDERVSIDMLNDDCLVHILLYLDPMSRIPLERVSKRWKRCVDRAFKQQNHVTVRKHFKYFQESMFYKILKRCSTQLCSLDVSYVSSQFENKAMEVIAKCCPGLENLNMSRVSCNGKGMEILSSRCRDLKHLNTVGCSLLSEKGFWFLFHNCLKLQTLICSGSSMITGKCFKYATSHFKHLDAKDCTNMSDKGIMQLAERCPNLEVFNVNNCQLLTRQTMEAIVKSCPKLWSLNVGGLDFHDENRLPHFTRELAKPDFLTSLVVDNAGLSDEDVELLCTTFTHLVELDISCNHLTDKSICQLSCLRHLEVLSLCHLFKITNTSLMASINHEKLKVIRVQGCKKLDDNLFQAIAAKCPCLQELDIAAVYKVTDVTIKSFINVLRQEPTRKLVIYVWRNDFHTSYSLTDCPNLTIVANFRHLYTTHHAWVSEADEYPGKIILLPAWEEIEAQPEAVAYYDDGDDYYSDYDEDNGDGDGFLENDDPLEMERFNRS